MLLPFISLLQIAGSEANDFFLSLTDIQSPIIVGRLLVDALLGVVYESKLVNNRGISMVDRIKAQYVEDPSYVCDGDDCGKAPEGGELLGLKSGVERVLTIYA
ncbi:hypothetical protein BDZ97DRAFT_2062223 [Flammula alnicola]|nr:hypothetical protein BDZ97DRAFT_2062223 [Flammula alnicola]